MMKHTIMWFLFILSVWLGVTGTQGISIYPGASGEILPGVQDQDQQMPNLLLNPREEVPLNLDQSGKEVEEPEVDQGSKRYDMPDTEYIQNHTSRPQSGKLEGEPSTRRVGIGLKEQDVHYRTTVKTEDRQNSSADVDVEASGFGQARLDLPTLPHQESQSLRSPSTSRLELPHRDITEHSHITEHPARRITERPPIENTPKPQKESTEQRPVGYFSSKKTEIPIEQTEPNVTEIAEQQRHVQYLTEPSLINFTVADRTLPNPRSTPAQPDSVRTLPTPREQVVQTYRKTTSNRPTENGHGSLRTLPAPEEVVGEGNRTMFTPSGASSLTIRTLPTPSDVHKTVRTLPNPDVTEEPVTQPELARTAKLSGTTTIGRLHQLTTGATENLILTNISPTPVHENGQAGDVGNSDGHGDNSGEDKDSGKYEPEGGKVVDKETHETVYISNSSIAQHRGKYYATTTTVSSLAYTKSSSMDEHSRSSNVLLSSRIVELPTLVPSEHIQMLQSHSYPWKESSINTKYVTSSTVPFLEPSLVHVSLPSSLHTTSEEYVQSTVSSTFTHVQGTVSFNVSSIPLSSSFSGSLSVTSSVQPMPHVTPDVELLHTSIPIVSHKTQTSLTPFLLNTKLSTYITFSSTPSSSSRQSVFVLSYNPTLSASVVHNLPNGSHDLILNENQTHSTAVPSSPKGNTTTPITPTVKKKSDSLTSILTTSKSELNRTERTNISTALTTKGKVVVLSTKPNNQMTPFRFSSSVSNIRTTGATTTARHHNDINQHVATSLPNATSPQVFITVVLRMTSFDFCAVKTLFKEDLQRVISENGHTVHDEQIVIISNIADKTCLLPDNNSQQQVTETTIHFYFVDSEGKLDVLSTKDYGKLLESGFRANTAHFRDKLLSVKLIQRENNDVKSSEQSISQTYPAEMQPGITMVVVIASVGGICCVALVALQAVLVYRRNGAKKMHPHMLSRSSVRSIDSVALGVLPKSRPNSGYWNPALEQNESGTTETKEYSHLLNYSGLSDFCQDINKIYEEFKTIPNEMPGMIVVPYGAEEKNRFANVIPHPHTRVRLKKNPGDDGSDYINANYVTGYKDDHFAYIATQAPMVNTVQDFWKMVWEQQSRAILMLTPMNVIGQPVCNTYWPDSEGMDALRKYGDFTIALRRKDVQQEYTELVLEMKDLENNLLREIHHFWFTNWPSNSEPDPLSVVKFVLDTRPHYEDSGAPVIVHCSPGTGRTGTFIAVDISMRMFEDKRKVDIQRCVYKMRQERAGVVQTKEQYALIYRALHEYATIMNSPTISTTSSAATLHNML